MFVQGEYGIGKSSVARYCLSVAHKEGRLLGLYVTLGQAESLEDFASALLEAIVRTSSKLATPGEEVKGFLGKYIKQVELFGVELNTSVLREDASKLTSPRAILNLLGETLKRLGKDQLAGVFLILDEINGICANPLFAHFLKDLVDTNAVEDNVVPMLLMLCGTENRRFDLIKSHLPVGRIFDVLSIDPMDGPEIREFFQRAFYSVQTEVSPVALDFFVRYSGGLPKIMHEIGDAAYFLDDDSKIDRDDALAAIRQAADEVGRKYVEPGVIDALKSKAYHTMLDKLSKLGKERFTRDELVAETTEEESKKLDNFLQRLQKLEVIRAGDFLGEYIFNVKLFQVYLTLKTLKHSEP